MNFSVQSDGLREMEEAITAMLTFTWDVDSPWAPRRHPYSMKPQTTTETPYLVNLAATSINAYKTRKNNQRLGEERSGSDDPHPFAPQ